MLKGNVSLRSVGYGCFLAFVVNALVLLAGALLLQNRVLGGDAAHVIVLAALVAACFCGTFLAAGRGGELKSGVLTGVCIYVILLVAALSQDGAAISFSATVKNLIAVLCGNFLGNFFGIRKHNRLRKVRKIKRRTTK